MRSYEKQIQEFAKEIADENITKSQNPGYEPVLDLLSVARSISNIYSVDLRKATEDLESEVRKSTARTLNPNR